MQPSKPPTTRIDMHAGRRQPQRHARWSQTFSCTPSWTPSSHIFRAPSVEHGGAAAKNTARSEGDHRLFLEAQGEEVLLARVLHHGGRAAHQHQRVVRRGRQALLDHIRGDEARLALPVRGREVQRVEQAEAPLAGLRQLVEDISAEDIVLRLVGVDQTETAGVLRIP